MTDWVLSLGDMEGDPPTAFHWKVTETEVEVVKRFLGTPHRETTGTGDGIVVI